MSSPPPRRSASTGSDYVTPTNIRKEGRRSLRKLPSYESPSIKSPPLRHSSLWNGETSPGSNHSSPPNEPCSLPITPGSRDNSPPSSVDSSPPRGGQVRFLTDYNKSQPERPREKQALPPSYTHEEYKNLEYHSYQPYQQSQPREYSPPTTRLLPSSGSSQLPPGISPIPPQSTYKIPPPKLHSAISKTNEPPIYYPPPSAYIQPPSLPPPPISLPPPTASQISEVVERPLSPSRRHVSPSRYRQGRPDIPSASSPNKSHRRGPTLDPNPRSSPQRGTRGRIDSSQMPRPKVTKPSYPLPTYHTKSSSKGGRKLPPSYLSEFTAVDCGNCSPRYMRATTTAPPSTSQLKTELLLPLSITVTPFALPENVEMDIPLVDMREYGQETSNPIRCSRCKGYINPHVQWVESGNKWKCNLCATLNTTPSWYYSPIDGDSNRLDRFARPELWAGSIDYQVSKDYCVTEPQEAVYVFCVDCSPRAIVSGAMSASLTCIQSVVNQLYEWACVSPDPFEVEPGDPPFTPQKIKIGIVTFNEYIHYYWVRPDAPHPIRLYNVDPDDPFPPLPSTNWLMDLSSQKTSLDLLLDKIPDILEVDKCLAFFPLSPNIMATAKSNGRYAASTGLGVMPVDPSRQIFSQACPTAVLKCVQIALETIGGRIMLLTDSNPDKGFGKIKRRPKPDFYGNSEEFLYYGALDAIVASVNNQSFSIQDITGNKTKKSPQITTEDLKILEDYIELGKQLHRQKTTVDVFYLAPSLNTIVENDLERWGYMDPTNPSLTQIGPSVSPPPTGLNRSLSSNSTTVPSPGRPKPKLTVNTTTQLSSDSISRGSPMFPTGYVSQGTPRQADVLKCSNDNSAIYSELTRTTGGNLHLFFGSLHLEDNVDRLKSQMLYAVKTVTGSEVVMKLRCSTGLSVESYYGLGLIGSQTNDEVELSGIDRDMSASFSIRQSSSFQDGEPVYFQLAILYTSLPSSQRIVRVHNLQLYSSSDPAIVFKHADVDCLVTYYTKMAMSLSLSTPLVSTRPSAKEYQPFRTTRNPKPNICQYLLDSCLDILLKYRQICSSHSPKGQLILPEALKVLPLYTLCLIKHPALLHNNLTANAVNMPPPAVVNKADRLAVDVCERAAEINRLLRCSPRELLLSLYPRLYPLHRLQDGDGYPIDELDEPVEHWLVQMPTWVKASAESIDSDGIYLLDDGEVLWLYFGRCVEQDKITELLGVSAGATPLSNNAAFQKKKTFSQQSSFSTSGEYYTDSDNGDSQKLYRKLSSGEIPPAIEPRSEWARRVQCIIDCARQRNSMRPELKIVWGGEINSSNLDVLRFGIRLVEDSIYGIPQTPPSAHSLLLSHQGINSRSEEFPHFFHQPFCLSARPELLYRSLSPSSHHNMSLLIFYSWDLGREERISKKLINLQKEQ